MCFRYVSALARYCGNDYKWSSWSYRLYPRLMLQVSEKTGKARKLRRVLIPPEGCLTIPARFGFLRF